MQPLQWEYRPDGLRAPAVVCAFKGWNDAADAASSAATFVGSALSARRFATIDPEDFYDFQSTRPRIKLVEGATREIVWPEVELFEARVPRAPRDLIVITGNEPSFRWHTFTKLIVELVEALGAQLAVTLGSLLADVPHTRPVSVTGLASDPALVARLSLTTSSYEGPTGIVGVLHAACQEAGLPSASLWAAVPITSPPPPTRRPRWRWSASWRGWSGSRSTRQSSRPPRRSTTARSTSPCRATRMCRRSSSGSSRPPVSTQTRTRGRSRPARRSRVTYSASCGSEARTNRRGLRPDRPPRPAARPSYRSAAGHTSR